MEIILKKTEKIDSILWSSCIRHVIDVEDSFLVNKPFLEIIIHVNDEDSGTDDETFGC